VCYECKASLPGDEALRDDCGVDWIQCEKPVGCGRWYHKVCVRIMTPADNRRYSGDTKYSNCPTCVRERGQRAQGAPVRPPRTAVTAPRAQGRSGTSAHTRKCTPRCPGCAATKGGCAAGMGQLTHQQRNILTKALIDLDKECQRISSLPPQPGERVIITDGGRSFEASVLAWGPNNIHYEKPTTDGTDISRGERGKVGHDQGRLLRSAPSEFTTEQLSKLARVLDLPYGVRQLKFEIPRTRAVLRECGRLAGVKRRVSDGVGNES